MDQVLQRVLVHRWLRGAVVTGLLLATPAGVDLGRRVFDPGTERRQLAYAVERQQRSAGETFVTASGEQARAVVFTPMHPSEAEEAVKRSKLVRWSRILAALSVLSLIAQTWDLLHDGGARHQSRPAS